MSCVLFWEIGPFHLSNLRLFFVVFSYCPLMSVESVVSSHFTFNIGNLCLLFFVSFTREGLAILLIFSKNYLFINISLLFLFSFSMISALISSCLLWVYFALFLDSWGRIFLIWKSSTFLMYAFSVIHFPFSTDLAASHKFWYGVFHVHLAWCIFKFPWEFLIDPRVI